MDLEQLYKQRCETESDINEHLPTLRRLAAECRHVTEFGVRYGVSTVALLASGARVTSYDISISSQATELCRYGLAMIGGDTLRVEIEPTDMLFIDTLHTQAQVIAELDRHAHKVAKYLVFHDTVTYGYLGEDGSGGLLLGIWDYMARNHEWEILENHMNNNGLLVLRRAYSATRP